MTTRVAAIARTVTRKVDRSGKRGLYLDCGANLGQGFAFFRRYFPDTRFDAILIEPNPNCAAKLRDGPASDTGVDLIEAALAGAEGEGKLFGLVEDHRGVFSDGASILATHNTIFYAPDGERAVTVQKPRLSHIIAERAQRYSAIVVKLDIEGAEYEVLEDLFVTGAIGKLDALFVEFHAKFMEPVEAKRHHAIEDQIRARLKAEGVAYLEWI